MTVRYEVRPERAGLTVHCWNEGGPRGQMHSGIGWEDWTRRVINVWGALPGILLVESETLWNVEKSRPGGSAGRAHQTNGKLASSGGQNGGPVHRIKRKKTE